MRRRLIVVVKHRLRGDGRIWVDAVKTKVLKDAGGWYVVESPLPRETARLLFRDLDDLVLIDREDGVLRVSFRKGEGEFEWDGRRYHVATMVEGDIRIDQEGRPVARGHGTVSGIALDFVATELLPIIRPLAWGLTLKTEEIARVSRIAPPV